MIPWWISARSRTYREQLHGIAVAGEHAVAVGILPALHREPFDRLRGAQAQIEGIVLLTREPIVAAYPGPIRVV